VRVAADGVVMTWHQSEATYITTHTSKEYKGVANYSTQHDNGNFILLLLWGTGSEDQNRKRK